MLIFDQFILKCDVCNRNILIHRENCVWGSKCIKIACPFCFEDNKNRVLSSHVIGIKYRGKWRKPEYFFYKKGKNGFVNASKDREYITVDEMISDTVKDDLYGHCFTKNIIKNATVLYNNGEIVGYFIIKDFEETPALRQLYVRPKFRNQGYATLMVREFLTKTSKDNVLVEYSSPVILHILYNLGVEFYINIGYG